MTLPGTAAEASLPLRSPPSGAELVTDRLEKPSLDNRSYRVIRLANELEVLLVHDPETDKASAAMDVNVGNFSDEPEMPGMAHAVEHLLFLGTKTFPGENEYNQYLSAHSGTSNAYTGATSTNYYFELSGKPANEEPVSAGNPSPLHGALDRFSKFFIEPLFLADMIDRELNAVDSEHKKNLQNDAWRIHQLDKSLSNPEHPYSNFSTGNLEILKLLPEAQGINVRDKFMEFHAKHYSSNRMKLVILGREPIELLESWAVSFFSDVPNKHLKQNRWEDRLPYRDSDLARQTFIKPVMDRRDMSLRFLVPEETDLHESKPSSYISHLIGHEGPGSLMAYTKSKGWVTGVSSGSYAICPGTPGIFECQVYLTEEGLNNWKEIAKTFFQYVSMLREAPPEEWIFTEMKNMGDVDFKFKEKTPASRFTSRISSTMQMPLPREWLLSHGLFRKFEPERITACLNALVPDNLRLGLISQTYPADWDQKEKYYGTEYRTEGIPSDFLEELRGATFASAKDRSAELHLPHKNSFIPTKLEVDRKDVEEPMVAPRLIRNDYYARTWWKKDDTFWVPRANVIVAFHNPIILSSAEDTVKAILYAELVKDALEEYAYDARLAGLAYTVSVYEGDIILDLGGYNDKLPVLLEKVLVTMRDLEIKEARFDIVKDRIKRGFHNWQYQSSYLQLEDYTNWITQDIEYDVEEQEAELPSITLESTRQFHKRVLSKFYLEVYVHGNLYKDDALTLTDLVQSTMRPRIMPRAQMLLRRTLLVPPGSNFVYERPLKDPGNVNHAIEYVLFTGPRSDKITRAKTLLIEQMLHEPAFDQLRTKEQLGYVVFSGTRVFWTMLGFMFMVQSEKSPQFLESRIEAFLENYAKVLEDMSDEAFEGHKRSVIAKRLEKLKNLDQESSRHWTHICNGYYDFSLVHQDAENIKRITKADMVDIWHRAISPLSQQRAKLSVHLLALGALTPDEKIAALVKELELSEADGLKLKAILLQSEKRHDLPSLKDHLLHDLHLSADKIDKVLEVAQESQKPAEGINGVKEHAQEIEEIPPPKGPKPVIVTDVWKFRASLTASAGPTPVKDFIEYEEMESKL